MKSVSSQEVVWILGVFLGAASIVAAMYLDDKSLIVAQDYKAVLPSIAFIAASTSLVAVAEAFDLAMRQNKQDMTEKEISVKIGLLAVNVVLALGCAILFAKDVSRSSDLKYVVDSYDVGLAVFSVILSLFVTFNLKRSLRGV